jgi:reversibly glycosylated polypeptide/UDP-arabinopyranose mutase
MKKVLVVPTIRENSIKSFLSRWDESLWDAIIVVEDNPEPTFDIKVKYHYCWKDIDTDLKENASIISRRDSGIKCYGFLKAYQMGADYIFCLDDDCYPIDVLQFQEKHVQNMEQTPRWTQSILGQRTRGIPYHNLGILSNVVFSIGLWKGIPDYDAVQSLAQGVPTDFCPPSITRIIPKDQYFNFCGMNFAFKREVAPLCYFPLMGQSSPFGRFDDIWFGIIAKKICDHLGYHISCGEPFVVHERASDTMSNLVKEAPGIQFNEELWEIIDDIEIQGDTPISCMNEIGVSLEGGEHYLSQLGKAMQVWSKLF